LTYGTPADQLRDPDMAKIGYVHQEAQLPGWMKVSQLIRYVAAYYETWDNQWVEKYIDLIGVDLNVRVAKLSPGQRQKVSILLALGHQPSLVILDEPAAALDPITRSDFLDVLTELIQEQNRCILISSHILTDIEKIVDHIIMLDKGHLIADQSLKELQESYCRVQIQSSNGNIPDSSQFPGECLFSQHDQDSVIILFKNPDRDQLQHFAVTNHLSVQFLPLSLEDLYRAVLKSHQRRLSWEGLL
jgi:ABC-2 type transport system ATP-binding protein